MIWICLAMIGIGFAFSLPLCSLLVYGSRRLGLIDQVGKELHKRHARPVPNTGGIAIFLAVAFPVLLILLAVWMVPFDVWWRTLPRVAVHLPGLQHVSPVGGAILAAMGLLHILGLVDDRQPLGPWSKLTAQLLVAVGLVLLADMRVLEFLGGYGWWGWALSAAVSAVWIVTIINAFNFLDNMDGLSAGVAAIAISLYLAATLIGQQWFVAGLCALLLGALLGFLVFNFPPASIFMGDGGSLVVGLLVAVISIRTTYFGPDQIGTEVGVQPYGLLMPLMVLAIPLYDFASVTLIRLAQGRSPFHADQSHFSHRLVATGLTRRRAVGVIWLCTLATGLAGVMLGSLELWQALIAGGQTIVVLALLALLEGGWSRQW